MKALPEGHAGVELLGQAAVATDQGEAAFGQSAACLAGKADVTLRLADDLNADRGGVGDALAR